MGTFIMLLHYQMGASLNISSGFPISCDNTAVTGAPITCE